MAHISPDSSDFASLPAHLLDSIMEKYWIDLPDFIRFAAVCKPWFDAATFNHQKKQQQRDVAHKQIPMLMVPSSHPKDNNSDGEGQEKRSLYGITLGKLYDYELPFPCAKRCCGSSHGWLATVDENYAVTIINPFSRVFSITLPHLLKLIWTGIYRLRI
ncbi:uncharacterized protein LOC131321315 [Rhododendron vialii]|uniref:uncharacterized protein LOC131321315 n=1 Tax=Rhododendron vialii TaxID=182163 RepID=UPI00265F948B|nr:uncharacterized protein LOC131321315 [Rhododendron vialii]